MPAMCAVPLLAAAAAATPATVAIVSAGHECAQEKAPGAGGLGIFPTPEACAVRACESGAGCSGYFMYLRSTGAHGKCILCEGPEAGYPNDAWDVWSYSVPPTGPPTPAPPPTPGPCDILAAAGNKCVAAHSTVRALYKKYAGPLYEVSRPNNASANISVLAPGGFASIAAHEQFCAAGDCVFSAIFDQSPQGNHLRQRISCHTGEPCPVDRREMVDASRHKIAVAGGVEVFGMWFDRGHGYHVDFTTGIAKGNDPESIYAVMSGTHFNDGCCFDYGNSENTVLNPVSTGDYACGSMEAIYFGNAHWQGNTGDGSTGPWVGADLEAGMFYGGGNATKVNPANKPLTTPFVSLHLKGRTDGFALKGGDATKGAFQTMYDGPRPDMRSAGTCQWHGVNGTFQPMRKQGAIILGTGGDNSNGGVGNFYEGLMAAGVTSAATDAAIQANIVAVGYKTLP